MELGKVLAKEARVHPNAALFVVIISLQQALRSKLVVFWGCTCLQVRGYLAKQGKDQLMTPSGSLVVDGSSRMLEMTAGLKDGA